jgi:hypothetical protein
MAINVAGTNALGDYLVSEIANVRTLMGMPTTSSSAPSLGSSAVPATAAPQKALTPTQLRDDVRAQALLNTQILFGLPTATNNADAGALPAIAGQTPQQLREVSVQSSRIALEFATIATLFGPRGIGGNTDTAA